MYNLRENSATICSTNEAFESDSNYHNDYPELSQITKDISHDNFIDRIDKDRNPLSQLVPPVITITGSELSLDSLTISGEILHGPSNVNKLFDVEETESRSSISNKDKQSTNPCRESMSLSNFKLIRGIENDWNRSNNSLAFQREGSRSSAIQMKKVPSELSVQTGDKFRKTSTFLVSRKESNASFGDDELVDIKLIEKPNIPELFIEFDSLHVNPLTNNYCWVEKSRWLKFEEDYNSDTRRFDSPHLSPISIQGITNFKILFSKGEAVLDCHQEKFINVLNNISDSIIKGGAFSQKEIVDIRNALTLKHYHAGEMMKKSSSEVTLYHYDNDNQCFQPHLNPPTNQKRNHTTFTMLDNTQRVSSHVKLDRKLEPGTESLSVQVGALESLQHTFSLFVRLDPPIRADGLNEVNCPLRFLFMVFGPKYKEEELLEVGRVFSVMMSNPEYREIGYSANNKDDFLTAIDSFVNQSVLVPLNKVITHDSLAAMLTQMKHYFHTFQSKQNQKLFDQLQRKISSKDQEVTVIKDDCGLTRHISVNSRVLRHGPLSELSPKEQNVKNMKLGFKDVRKCCQPFCSLFRYFYYDWIGLKSRYLSDFQDAFRKENAPIVFFGMFFIYFVVMVPAITFGSLLSAINPLMTLMMMLLASGVFQLFHTLFGGQPFEIIGITGPVFAVEVVLSSLASYASIELGPMRFWIGIYVACLGFIFTAFNGVIIIQYVRISVEEIYSFLVDAIYISSALFYMFKAIPQSVAQIIANETIINNLVTERLRFGIGGVNLFLAFFMTNFCLLLVGIKNGSFFSRQIRNLLGSLNVPLGILLIIALEKIFFNSYNLPTLNVQTGSIMNMSIFLNIPSTFSISPQGHGLCFAISISLFAILTCEISTNSITATKSERKLMKPSLYSINYFYILVLFPVISGLLGWPFVSGAPVRSHAHCIAMSIWSVNVPGIASKVIGAVEQRISGILVGILVLMSIFLGSILQHVPMAAMYGMFLYMGIMGAADLIFIRRLICLLQHRKYWLAHDYLKDYPTWHIVILVLIQIFFVTVLIVLNCLAEFTSLKWTPLLFPFIILIFGFLRAYILPRWSKLNTHLPKMDRKHPIKLYADQHAVDQVIVTVEQNGGIMTVVHSKNLSISDDKCDSSDSENK